MTQSLNSVNTMENNLHSIFNERAHPTQRYAHENISEFSLYKPRMLRPYQNEIADRVAHEMDEHEIDNPLSKEATRILFKILRKELPDCGRKRGAILRYIKAYTPEPERNLSYAMYNHIRNL